MNTHEKFTGIASRTEAQTSISTSVNIVAVAMVTAQQQHILSSRAAVASIQDSSEKPSSMRTATASITTASTATAASRAIAAARDGLSMKGSSRISS
jgi:hypothetical protein